MSLLLSRRPLAHPVRIPAEPPTTARGGRTRTDSTTWAQLKPSGFAVLLFATDVVYKPASWPEPTAVEQTTFTVFNPLEEEEVNCTRALGLEMRGSWLIPLMPPDPLERRHVTFHLSTALVQAVLVLADAQPVGEAALRESTKYLQDLIDKEKAP